MKIKRKKIGMEMRPDLHSRMHQKAVGDGLKLYEAMEKAIEKYLGINGDPVRVVPRKYQHYMDKLAKILTSEDWAIIDVITSSLELLHDRLRSPEVGGVDDHGGGGPLQ